MFERGSHRKPTVCEITYIYTRTNTRFEIKGKIKFYSGINFLDAWTQATARPELRQGTVTNTNIFDSLTKYPGKL